MPMPRSTSDLTDRELMERSFALLASIRTGVWVVAGLAIAGVVIAVLAALVSLFTAMVSGGGGG